MKKNKIFVIIICISFLFLQLMLPLPSIECGASSEPVSQDKQDQIQQIESKLSKEKRSFEAFSSREKDLLKDLSDLENEVREKKQAVEAMKKNIETAKAEAEKLGSKLPNLESSLKSVEGRLEERLVALYKYAKEGYIMTLAGAADLDQFRRRVKYAWCFMEEDRKTLEALGEQAFRYRDEMSHIRKQIAKTATSREAQRVQLASLRADLEKKVILLVKVHKEKEFYETAVKELESAAQDMKSTIKKIEARKVNHEMQASRFIDSKGKLPMPLEGRIVKGGQFLKTSVPNLHKGVFIEGPSSDMEVRAVFPGRVDFSGSLKGYGEMVVINHGSRFFTISALLSERRKEEGDKVHAGEVIGRVRGEGTSKGSRLYFEIREGAQNLDPSAWLGNH